MILRFTLLIASPDNLKRWGKRKMGTCPLCSSPNGTLAHITNMCPVSLQQGRFTWRHDSVLHYITSQVKQLATPNTDVYSDLPGQQINGTTVPADILVSSGEGSKPDLVIIDRTQSIIALLELTCPLESNVESAHKMKQAKYTQLELSLNEK